MDPSKVSNLILAAIQSKQSEVPICPTIDYIHENTSAYVRMQKQFYNPQVQEALSCLVKTAVDSFNLARKEEPEETAKDLAITLKRFFGNAEDITRHLDIRTVDTSPDATSYAKQVNELLVESYAGIVFLNDLRAYTPSFKYIYIMLSCGMSQRNKKGNLINVCSTEGNTPHIIEESLATTIPLRMALNELSADEAGIHAVKSIILQLFVAVEYAAREDISNFPMEIVIRKVDPNSFLPLYLEKDTKYIKTLGFIPIFERYHTVAIPIEDTIYGTPKALLKEQNDIVEHIMVTLSAVNPKLRKIFPETNSLSFDFFSEVIQESAPEEMIFSCVEKNTCEPLTSFINYFTLPYARLDVYVRSGVERIDQLRSMLEVARNPNEIFLISGVMIEYAQLLNTIAGQVSPEIRRELFPPKRYFQPGISQSRYVDISRGIVKPDLEFIRESFYYNYVDYTNENCLAQAINRAREVGYELHKSQKKFPLPNIDSAEGIFTSIISMRNLITNLNYYSTTNALIEKYRKHVGEYPHDLSEATQEAQYLKERYDNLFAENPGIIGKYVRTIDTDDKFILANLYDTFIEDLPDYLEKSLEAYTARRTAEELAYLYSALYQEKLVASDPIPLIVSLQTSTQVMPLSQ